MSHPSRFPSLVALVAAATSLAAGIYRLALYDDAPDSGLAWEMSDGGRGDGFVSGFTFDSVRGPNDGSGNLAFELHGTTVTPEPVSMVLLGTGLAGIARRRRGRTDGNVEPATRGQ